ncbi:acetolactate synthase [Xylella taiwanensis]|uniref:Acetolactate synthase n=1 Tax=Xylella taiwanensis TaxID=1444770 RepID=Z9JI16_9GAMM|nr:ACT domain-containing protein [Xylella taiwanensis]AXI83507.1 acetolactate synthase [Xylella taiwanensis]EWS78010.1 acetolactate synthase [Xylella taiwanensis]MCD8456582.1 acetolactate synthase [Xylella taiwanensis]MCD8458989.1 acetolactate synthase [Xylella taiwanensis]MCD8461128.1 acetolactate synthase [Xylella taiwanensis]
MQYRLDLVLKPAEGAILRVLGMTERRGFRACAIHGSTVVNDAGRWHLQMVVDGSRSPETLRLQLEKVYDCESVAITALEAA